MCTEYLCVLSIEMVNVKKLKRLQQIETFATRKTLQVFFWLQIFKILQCFSDCKYFKILQCFLVANVSKFCNVFSGCKCSKFLKIFCLDFQSSIFQSCQMVSCLEPVLSSG